MSGQSGSVDLVLNLRGQAQAVSGLNQFGAAIKDTGRNVESAIASSNLHFRNLEGSIGSLVKAAAGLYVFNQVNGAIRATVEASLELQRVQRTLDFAAGGPAEGAKEMSYVRTEVDRLGLALGSTATDYAKLSAASRGTILAGQGTRDIFQGVAEASAALNLSADNTSGVLLAVEQMISKGTVAAEELRGQLGERLPGAFQLAAKAMGVTTQELDKMLQKGQVLAVDFLPAFAKQLHLTYAEAAIEAAKGGQAALNRFNNEVLLLKAQLGDALLPTLIKVSGEVGAMVKHAQETGQLKVAFEDVGKAIEFAAGHVHALVIGGEALLAIFAVRKIAAIVVEVRALALALQALTLANPVLAALSLSVGAGVVAYHMAKDAAQDFNNEAQNIKEGEKQLAAYALQVDTVAQKFDKLHKDWENKSPFPNVAPPPGTPANPTPPAPTKKKEVLTAEQVNELATLEKEAQVARLEATKTGLSLQLGMEQAEHKRRLEKFKESATLTEAENARHQARVLQIIEDYGRRQAVTDFKIKHEAQDEMREMLKEEARWKREHDDKLADSNVAAMHEGEAKRLAEVDASVAREKQAFEFSDAWKQRTAEERNAVLNAIEQAGANKRKQIQKDETMARIQMGSELVTNLIQGLDAFYGHSKKNALLHKALAVSTIEIDGAMAAMKAYESAQDLPFPFGPIVGAGLATAVEFRTQGYAYKASQQKFANSGVVQGDSRYGDNVPVMANAGELFINPADQRTLLNLVRSGAGGAGLPGGGNTVHLTYAPVYPAMPASAAGAQSFTDMARADRVEFARFINLELRPKGYIR